jgi:DNA recombination protein RmuC
MTIMFAVWGVVALAAGAAIGWVIAQRAVAERDLARTERMRAEAEKRAMQAALDEARSARVAAETRLIEAERLIIEKNSFLEDSKKQLEDSFAALAQRTLKVVAEQVVQVGKTQIDGSLDTKKAEIEALLKPMREMVDNYRGELMKSEQSRVQAYGGLQEQIKALLVAQESTSREASRLANALQSPTVRGSWGESSLRRCVELAGMSEFCDFTTQETFFTDEGRRLRPDLIVKLPNERVIAIDAKVPLSEYTVAANETDEVRRNDALQQHAKTMRRHIDALSRREYQSNVGETLDFVVLFIPGEHFLSAALMADPTLFEYAADRKIFLASPTVLLPLLRAVYTGWKAERTEQNAKKIHDAGVELFTRFVKVMDHISEVGVALRRTVERYNGAIGSIDRMLWPKGEELQRMAGIGKQLGDLDQIEATPLESSKLKLHSQTDGDADVLQMKVMRDE